MRTVTPARVRELERLADTTDRIICGCWCERRFGLVSRDDVKKGQTFSCGHPWCRRANG